MLPGTRAFANLPAAGMPVRIGQLLVTSRADYNRNGAVAAADYNTWRAAFGSTQNLDADGNGDGVIDAADYTTWRDNLGLTAVASGTAANAIILIPEPASPFVASLWVAICLITVCLRRRFDIEPQVGFAGSRIRPVAGEAIVRQTRPHIAVEINPLGGCYAAYSKNHSGKPRG